MTQMNRSSSLFLATIHFTYHVFSHGSNQVVPAPSVGTCASSSLCLHSSHCSTNTHLSPSLNITLHGQGPDFDSSGGPRRFNSGSNASGSCGPEPGGLFHSIFGGFGNNNINGNNDRSGSGFSGRERRSSDPTPSRRNRRGDSHNDRYLPGAWSEDLD